MQRKRATSKFKFYNTSFTNVNIVHSNQISPAETNYMNLNSRCTNEKLLAERSITRARVTQTPIIWIICHSYKQIRTNRVLLHFQIAKGNCIWYFNVLHQTRCADAVNNQREKIMCSANFIRIFNREEPEQGMEHEAFRSTSPAQPISPLSNKSPSLHD